MNDSLLDLSRLELAHTYSFKNELSIKEFQICGCFKYIHIFPSSSLIADDFHDESDGTKTVFCPKCGTDSVIGDKSDFPITTHFLAQMNSHFFLGYVG